MTAASLPDVEALSDQETAMHFRCTPVGLAVKEYAHVVLSWLPLLRGLGTALIVLTCKATTTSSASRPPQATVVAPFAVVWRDRDRCIAVFHGHVLLP